MPDRATAEAIARSIEKGLIVVADYLKNKGLLAPGNNPGMSGAIGPGLGARGARMALR